MSIIIYVFIVANYGKTIAYQLKDPRLLWDGLILQAKPSIVEANILLSYFNRYHTGVPYCYNNFNGFLRCLLAEVIKSGLYT